MAMFSDYKGHGITPVSGVIEAGANIGKMYQQGIGSMGEGIGKGIEKYYQNQADNENLRKTGAGILGATISKYLVDDIDEKTGQPSGEKYIDPKAPQFIHDTYKKAIKESPDDWRTGMSAMSTSDIREMMATHQEWKVQDQQDKENEFKAAGLDLQRENTKLQQQSLKLQQEAAFWARKKDAEEAAIQEAKLEAINAPVDPFVKHTFTKREEVKTGSIFNPDTGEYYEDTELNQAAKTLGIKPTDIVAEEDYAKLEAALKGKPEQVVGKVFATNPKFDALASFQSQSGERTKDEDGVERTDTHRFIEGMYKTALRAGVNPDAAKKLFYGNRETGGINADINVNSETYAAAQKLAGKASIQEALKKQGVNLTPPVARGINKFMIMSGSEKSFTDERPVSVTIALTPREIMDEKYDAMTTKFREQGKPIPFTRDQLDTLTGEKSIPYMYLPNGQKVYIFGNKPYTEAQLNSLASGVDIDGSVPADETVGHAKLVMFDQWLRQFNKPVEIGAGFKVQFNGGYKNFRGDMEKDKEVIETSMDSLAKVNRVADGMLKLTNAGLAEKVASPEWNTEYENLRLTAETMRTYFISKGQETDKDNDRLRAIVADQGFWLKANPELAKKIIENFRAIVAEQATARIERAGFKIAGGQKSTVDRSALRAALDEAENKYQTKKK